MCEEGRPRVFYSKLAPEYIHLDPQQLQVYATSPWNTAVKKPKLDFTNIQTVVDELLPLSTRTTSQTPTAAQPNGIGYL